jgi:hypothetical protein
MTVPSRPSEKNALLSMSSAASSSSCKQTEHFPKLQNREGKPPSAFVFEAAAF